MESLYRKVEEMISDFGQRNCLALDIGCGTGYNTVKLQKITSRIVGLDVSNFVKKEYTNEFSFVLGNGKKMPFNNNNFDLITCWEVIEHIKEDKKFLSEIFRVLKPGGKVFMSTPNRNRLSNLVFRFFKKIEYPYYLGSNSDIGDVVHIREYTSKELGELCSKVGFKIEKNEAVFLGFINLIGLYNVPKMFKGISQHIFLTLRK